MTARQEAWLWRHVVRAGSVGAEAWLDHASALLRFWLPITPLHGWAAQVAIAGRVAFGATFAIAWATAFRLALAVARAAFRAGAITALHGRAAQVAVAGRVAFGATFAIAWAAAFRLALAVARAAFWARAITALHGRAAQVAIAGRVAFGATFAIAWAAAFRLALAVARAAFWARAITALHGRAAQVAVAGRVAFGATFAIAWAAAFRLALAVARAVGEAALTAFVFAPSAFWCCLCGTFGGCGGRWGTGRRCVGLAIFLGGNGAGEQRGEGEVECGVHVCGSGLIYCIARGIRTTSSRGISNSITAPVAGFVQVCRSR